MVSDYLLSSGTHSAHFGEPDPLHTVNTLQTWEFNETMSNNLK